MGRPSAARSCGDLPEGGHAEVDSDVLAALRGVELG